MAHSLLNQCAMEHAADQSFTREQRQATLHPAVRLMELAERNPSLGGRELLREIIERGALPESHESLPARDLREALRPRGLDDTDYRTPAEQAARLQQGSPALRDLYERGATLKGDTLVLPAEAHELNDGRATPFLTTLAYAQQRLPDAAQAREFHDLARTISGETADARTQLTVFRIYYDRLARDAHGQRLEKQDTEGRAEAVGRTLTEMRALAREMAPLETRDSLDAAHLPEQTLSLAERDEGMHNGTVNLTARTVDLRAESLRFPAGLSFAAKERLLTRTLPELDYRLEHGVPRAELFRAIDRRMARRDAEVELEKLKEIGGFLKTYLDERLHDPETRALHSSAVFREARAGILNARTPVELGRAAEDFLRANRRRSEELRQHLADPTHHPPPAQRPLDARERNLIFYGRAPEHHAPEMRELRIYYGLSKVERAARVAQLQRGELEPSPPLHQLLDELATRHTVKAVNHFQASLLNEQMKQASRVDLYQLNQQIPPHERSYLYETTEQRKQAFQRPPVFERETESRGIRTVSAPPPESASLREYLAHMGHLERQLLNAEVQRRSEARNGSEPRDLTITEARTLLPQQTQREVRVRASQLAWQALVPAEVFAPNPSLEAQRISETIAFMQEQLQERARTAQAAQVGIAAHNQAARSGAPSPVSPTLIAFERYAAQTREAVYRGFALLDEQRAALVVERTERQAGADAADLRVGLEQTPLTIESPNQEWHYDSLRDVLSSRFSPNAENHQRAKEDQLQLRNELEIER